MIAIKIGENTTTLRPNQVFPREHHRHPRHLAVAVNRSDEGRLHRPMPHGDRSLQTSEDSGWNLIPSSAAAL